MKTPNRLRTFFEYLVLAMTGGVSIVIAFLDFLGILDVNSWLVQRIPALTLLGIGSIASYLIFERRSKLDAISERVKQLDENVISTISRAIRSLDGVEVVVFDDGAKFLNYFLTRVQNAKRIDDISWSVSDLIPTKQEMEDFSRYRDVVAEVASRADVIWREIVIFVNKSRFEQIKRHLTDETPGYNVVFYDNPPSDTPLRISFAIVDNDEVFLAGQEHRLVIRHPDVVKYFSQYYAKLWEHGKPLKIGKSVKVNQFEAILNSLDAHDQVHR